MEMFLWVSGGIQRDQLIIEKERKKAPVFCFIYGFATLLLLFLISIALLLFFLFTSRGRNMVGRAKESIIV